MSRINVVLFAFLGLVSCQSKIDREAVTFDSPSGDTSLAAIEETQATTSTADESFENSADPSPYIGDVDAFQATHEYYTTVYYRTDVEKSDDYDLLAARADSVVHEDEEMRRKRVPYSIARQYFNLAGLEAISIYNDGHHVVDARFVRVELLEGMIESQFIAVFKPVDPLAFNPDVSYCISSGDITAKSRAITSQAIDDSLFTNELLHTFKLQPNPWNTVHVKTMPYEAIYSGITFQYKSLLIETHSGKSTILKEINEDYYIGAILPVHLEINGKPVLLLHMGVNETDMVWTSLAVYSGKEYQLLEGNRLRGKVYL